MRLLLVSDLHYTLKQLDWVVARADDYDVVVLAGDHLDAGSFVEPDVQIVVVLEYLARLATKATVIASSGNHDLNARNDHGEKSAVWLQRARELGVHTDGARVERDDAIVTVCEWWDGPRSRGAVDEQLRVDAEKVDDRPWIWVYHAPPDESPTSWTGTRHYGDADLRAWIAEHQPDLVLCGHVHESPFKTEGGWFDRIGATTVLNAGRQRGPLPAHVVVDTADGALTWISLAGVEHASLAPVA
ncbi:MAG TPA: metallophosphoesterase [Acidimicrobiia bacterium]|nr:metallophosphoesterase [Acidimicrobiia bacterium]